MSNLPRVLVLGARTPVVESVCAKIEGVCELTAAENLDSSLRLLQSVDFAGVCVFRDHLDPSVFLLEHGGVLQQIPDGIALFDSELRLLWCNRRLLQFLEQVSGEPHPLDELPKLTGDEMLSILGKREIVGPDFCPLHTALAFGEVARTTVRAAEKTYYQIDATPNLSAEDGTPTHLLVMVRDQSAEMTQRQKLAAIHRAGQELGDMQPDEVVNLTVPDRISLMKEKILNFTREVLEFETVEVRLLEKKTGLLIPLLADGMEPEAAERTLQVGTENNGVTGWVAATRRSYLCKDTAHDKLYLPGAFGAKSSLTVPLELHDEVIGTFNVESCHTDAFDNDDLKFLELFCREVAVALNTLDLLAAEQASTAASTVQQMLCDVAHPADSVLVDCAWLLAQGANVNDEIHRRLLRIAHRTRDVRSAIRRYGDSLISNIPGGVSTVPIHPQLVGKRILVADPDESVGRDAHELLGRYQCLVETVTSGEDAIRMATAFDYDAVLCAIRFPDLSGSEVFRQIRAVHPVPILMTAGFGHDPGHVLVKTRQMGMQFACYKPFKLDQLLKYLESSFTNPGSPGTRTTC